jgi:hypothetical protein
MLTELVAVAAVAAAAELAVVLVKGEIIKFLKNSNFIYCEIR